MRRYFGGALVLVAAINAGSAGAQLRTTHDIPLTLANEAVTAAVADCTAKGFSVAAAVVDRGGLLRVLQRADNAGPHTIDSARRKAYTALTTKTPTLRFGDLLKENPVSANAIYINEILVLGGGVPIKAGDEVVGAIGVGGTPSAKVDEDCAMAGIARIADRLK